MLTINDQNHNSLIVGSIDKVYNLSKIYGKFKIKNVYFLSILGKLLNDPYLTIPSLERNELMSIYYNVSFKSSEICRPTICKIYQSTPRPKFIQAEAEDCNEFPKHPKIYFWQDSDLSSTVSTIQALVDNTDYLKDKPSDTYSNFETGREVEYSNVGKICFLATESTTTNYTILDILGNPVTNAFDIVLIPLINSTLFVSKNIYSHGNIYFKIKK